MGQFRNPHLNSIELNGEKDGWIVRHLGNSHVWKLRDQAVSVSPDINDPTMTGLIGSPVFLVQHDWQAVCQNIDGYEETEFRLPFDDCIFEMNVGGAHVLAYFQFRPDEDPEYACMVFMEIDDSFVPYTVYYLVDGEWRCTASVKPAVAGLISKLVAQVRAVCVLKEVELVEAQHVSPPPKLQKARKKKNKPPLNEYFKVGLVRREADPLDSHEYKGVVRCHFRRGHWAMLRGKRVWRKWTIVGNPDLGFVDKTYILGGAS